MRKCNTKIERECRSLLCAQVYDKRKRNFEKKMSANVIAPSLRVLVDKYKVTSEHVLVIVVTGNVITHFLQYVLSLKAKFQCHPARCLLPVEIMQRCGLATGPAIVELLPYLMPY